MSDGDNAISRLEITFHAFAGLFQFFLAAVFLVAFVFLCVAFWSSSAVLIWEQPLELGTIRFQCKYVTGTRIVYDFSTSPRGCARWLKIENR